MRPAALLAVLAVTLSAGCTWVIGGSRDDMCGERPASGGPPVIVTRDQELCDVVRARVQRQLDVSSLKRDELDRLIDRTLHWETRDTLDEFVAAVRRDAGDAFADEVRRAVDAVAAQSRRTTRPDCADVQRCLEEWLGRHFLRLR